MALIHIPPVEAPTTAGRRVPNDEIVDLTDRRRILLRVVLGIDLAPDAVDDVFEPDHDPRPSVRPEPSVSVEGEQFAVEDHASPTA